MKSRRKFFAAVSSLAIALTVLLTGCGAPAQEGTALKETGILTLSVNPEIQIEYNRDGKVTALTGRNDDGKGIVEVYPDYIGKNLPTSHEERVCVRLREVDEEDNVAIL